MGASLACVIATYPMQKLRACMKIGKPAVARALGRMVRREEGEYPRSLTDEQRSQRAATAILRAGALLTSVFFTLHSQKDRPISSFIVPRQKAKIPPGARLPYFHTGSKI